MCLLLWRSAWFFSPHQVYQNTQLTSQSLPLLHHLPYSHSVAVSYISFQWSLLCICRGSSKKKLLSLGLPPPSSSLHQAVTWGLRQAGRGLLSRACHSPSWGVHRPANLPLCLHPAQIHCPVFKLHLEPNHLYFGNLFFFFLPRSLQ